MKKSTSLAAIALTTSACFAAPCWADGVPAAGLRYVGSVTDTAGHTLAGQQVKVSVFPAETDDGSAALCSSKPVNSDSQGSFAALLDKCDSVVHGSPNLWLEITVGQATQVVLPRQKLAAVPYALEAGAASSATGQLAAVLAALTNQLSNFAGQLASAITAADLSPLQQAVDALGTDVATLKNSPKASAQVVELAFGSGTMVETGAGTLVVDVGLWVIPQATLKPEFKIDGQSVGTLYAVNMSSGLMVRVEGKVAAPVTAGKHFLELGGAANCYTSYKCPVIIQILP